MKIWGGLVAGRTAAPKKSFPLNVPIFDRAFLCNYYQIRQGQNGELADPARASGQENAFCGSAAGTSSHSGELEAGEEESGEGIAAQN